MVKKFSRVRETRRKVRRRKLIMNVVSNDDKKALIERGELSVIAATEGEHV